MAENEDDVEVAIVGNAAKDGSVELDGGDGRDSYKPVEQEANDSEPAAAGSTDAGDQSELKTNQNPIECMLYKKYFLCSLIYILI